MRYDEKLKNDRWKIKSETIFRRDNYTCQRCGTTKLLCVHHLIYKCKAGEGNLIRDPWDYNSKFLITLCWNCHQNAHKVPITHFLTLGLYTSYEDAKDDLDEDYYVWNEYKIMWLKVCERLNDYGVVTVKKNN